MKNNYSSTVRIPTFESSPSRRRRIDNQTYVNNINSAVVSNEAMNVEHSVLLQKKSDIARMARQQETPVQRQMRLEKQRSRSQSRIANETEEQRMIRLEKQRERKKSKINNETEEERQTRLVKDSKHARSKRAVETEEQREKRLISNRQSTELARRNETDEQYQRRCSTNRESTRAARDNETEDQRQRRRDANNTITRATRDNETSDQSQSRKKKNNERTKVARQNETTEQHEKRLQQQQKLSQANRAKDKLDKRSSSGTYTYLRSITAYSGEFEQSETDKEDINKNSTKYKDSALPSWPEPIACSLKNSLLQQFVGQMSMSALAETTCAVCHVRTSLKKTRKISVKEIPNIHLLEVSNDLKDLIIRSHTLNSEICSTTSGRSGNLFEIHINLSGNSLNRCDP